MDILFEQKKKSGGVVSSILSSIVPYGYKKISRILSHRS